MSNYLRINVPISRKAEWFTTLQSKTTEAGIPVNWQQGQYHMTILYIKDDNHVKELSQGFFHHIELYDFMLPIDKLAAFTTENGSEHIICLKPLDVKRISYLAKEARNQAKDLNVDYDKRPFYPHITLGRVPADAISLDKLQTILQSVNMPKFECCINVVEHLYAGFGGKSIGYWVLAHDNNISAPNNQTKADTVGRVVYFNRKWHYKPIEQPVDYHPKAIYCNEKADLYAIPYTDHGTWDTFVIRHKTCEGIKYGIYSLPHLCDMGYDGTQEWIGQSKHAFPFDEVKVLGMNINYYGFIAFRIGKRWGIINPIYNVSKDRVDFELAVPCKYASLSMAEAQIIKWRTPFE